MRIAVFLVLALGVSGVAHAQAPDPIETRQAGQDLLGSTYGGIRAALTAKADVKSLELPARAMARWMRQFPSQFVKGTEQGHDTKAAPAIWTDSAGFQKLVTAFADDSDKLAQFAKAGDADGVAAQVKVVGDGCGACHRGFRLR